MPIPTDLSDTIEAAKARIRTFRNLADAVPRNASPEVASSYLRAAARAERTLTALQSEKMAEPVSQRARVCWAQMTHAQRVELLSWALTEEGGACFTEFEEALTTQDLHIRGPLGR